MSKKTIILYQPKIQKKDAPPSTPPLALLSISGLLLKENYEVKIFDAIVDVNAQDKVLKNLEGAICLGLSVWTGYAIKDSLDLCKKVRKINPNITFVWGGWHPSLSPEQTIKNPYVDIIVKGQGETTFLDLIKCLERKESLKNIQGIIYKSNGKIITTPDRPRTPLNDLPPMPYHLIDIEKYITQEYGSRTIGYISSQGCPYNCSFCADATLYKSQRMELSAERVIADLKNLIENYNINGMIFEDTNFFVNKEKVRKICQAIIDNKWDFKWGTEGRADQFITFDNEFMQLLKDSGCILLIVGAESGSQKILDFLNKQIKVEHTLKMAEICNKFDISTRFQIMVGLPDETEEDFKKTLDLMKHVYSLNNKNDITIYFYTPYPGTALYNTVIEKYGFEPPKSLMEWSNFDPINIEMKWVDKKYKERLENFRFYLQFAFLNERFKKNMGKSAFKLGYLLMHRIAKLRFDINFFRFPIEIKITRMFKRILK